MVLVTSVLFVRVLLAEVYEIEVEVELEFGCDSFGAALVVGVEVGVADTVTVVVV